MLNTLYELIGYKYVLLEEMSIQDNWSLRELGHFLSEYSFVGVPYMFWDVWFANISFPIL